MPKVQDAKWQRREKKLQKKKSAMRVSGRSVFTLQEIARRKAAEAKQAKSPKQSQPRD
ncbi:MAG: hypothetical protein KIT46_09435 [Anaerolineales bacterium]|nr:hypothetical protein [Anaerolineales bacterium]MCW5856252.1 hypothetical protein [Anaerolineales bacterium]